MTLKELVQLLLHLKAIVWDFDGVHYDYKTFPPLNIFDDVIVTAALRVLPTLTEKQAQQIGKETYPLYGDAVHGFTLWAQENGLDVPVVREKIFKGYHHDLFNRLARDCSDRIIIDPATNEAFHRGTPLVRHGIATHSSIEYWVKPFLQRQDRLKFFNENAMIGLDDVDFARKTESILALLRSLDALGVSPGEAAFVEDSLPNLEYAHEKLPGLTKIYIHYGKPLAVLPPYVTLQVSSPKELMQILTCALSLDLRSRYSQPGPQPL
jgi:FMN phosphatase YigB (HAD superfamily)